MMMQTVVVMTSLSIDDVIQVILRAVLKAVCLDSTASNTGQTANLCEHRQLQFYVAPQSAQSLHGRGR